MPRTGGVSVRNFDTAIVTHLGGVLVNTRLGGEAEARDYYCVAIPGIVGPLANGHVPIFWERRDVTGKYQMPCFVVRRTSREIDDNRRQGNIGRAYRVPAEDADPVEVQGPAGPIQGWSRYEQRLLPMPYTYTYAIEARAPRRSIAIPKMERLLQPKFMPRGGIVVLDDLDEARDYDMHMTGELDDTSDIVDLTGTTSAVTMTVTVFGEEDYFDATETQPVVGQPAFDVEPL